MSRVCDELAAHGIAVSLTTVLRWVKKAGEECVQPLHLFNQENWQQPLCIDEKWIKVRNKFFIKAFQMYYRLRKIRFGPFRGRSRLQLKRNPIGRMNFTDYLTPTFI